MVLHKYLCKAGNWTGSFYLLNQLCYLDNFTHHSSQTTEPEEQLPKNLWLQLYYACQTNFLILNAPQVETKMTNCNKFQNWKDIALLYKFDIRNL